MQPFDGSVTVTPYAAGLETVLVVVVFPPPQLNVAPAVVDDAVNWTVKAVQVKVAGGAIVALGAVIF